MKLLDKKTARHLTAAVVCAAMLAPVFVRGIPLEPWYDTERVKKTWEQPGIPERDTPTGLAFNWTIFTRNTNAECLFPFTQAMYFTARPGYIKDDYKGFDNRFLYCVASHTQGYRMEPGMQMFFLKDYGINHPNGLFYATKHGGGENVENFNFLMTAIACGYPDSYNPDNMADVPYYLICQTIAWVATNETSPGFQGVPEGADANSELEYFQRDLAFYKSQPEYAALEQSFPRNVAPEIYDRLHAAPPAGSAAAAAGMTNMVDAVFYDIWVAAYLTNRLTPDWDKEISATVTTAREENGKYYADVNLFVSDIAKRYLDGIDFQGFGDWTKESRMRTGRCISLPPQGILTKMAVSGSCIGQTGILARSCRWTRQRRSFIPSRAIQTRSRILSSNSVIPRFISRPLSTRVWTSTSVLGSQMKAGLRSAVCAMSMRRHSRPTTI